jgi:phosphatidylinositol-3-phosphatase
MFLQSIMNLRLGSVLALLAAVLAGLAIQAAPSVSVTSPTQASSFSAPVNISLTVNVADTNGTVTNVVYFLGATQLASVAVSPFSYTWSGVYAGNYAIQAVATDNNGLTATSGIVNMTVTNSPSLQALQQIKTIFVIGMENHNFTQPNPTSGTQQLFGNPAAPYLNSLITPGNSNAAQVSYADNYYNAGVGVHPSEPNYIWAEAGTSFGVTTDADPSTGAGNLFSAPHLTSQMNSAGITWKNYQEDLQYSSNPAVSSSGTSPTINPYYHTGQFSYAVKHNPMAFFTDTQKQNVYPLTNLMNDLASNSVGRYNWITPNLLNDQHDGLSGGFTYHGVTYTGDQAAVAQGDNFLAAVVPMIMSSSAYKSNGLIILRWDETEGGDNTNYTLPGIIISPLAKGNAYTSRVPVSHSSVVKTMEEIFELPFLTNSIPSGQVTAYGSGYNNVATVNDLSDMFQVNTNGRANGVVATGKILSGGTFQLTFSGNTGQTYEVLAADDIALKLSGWTVLTNGTFNGTNIVFSEPGTTNHAMRFYVVKSP